MIGVMRISPRQDLACCTPLDVLSRWPTDVPIAMLHSHPDAAGAGRWSVIGEPTGVAETAVDSGVWVGEPNDAEAAAIGGIMSMLRHVDAHRTAEIPPPEAPPFLGWIACLHYECGPVFEPSAGPMPEGTIASFLWCPNALLHDSVTNQWWQCGQPPSLLDESSKTPSLHSTGPIISTPPESEWPNAVAEAVEAIRAGDIFQVNLCRQLSVSVTGHVRGFAADALSEPQTSFGALLEIPGSDARTVVSLSPELFFSIDRSGGIVSKPIKGTLPAHEPAATLQESAKDAAELHMIVDLMRNDLGRVCTIGSVHVPNPRTIESHPTVHHGVGEVRGRLRPDASRVDVLEALFPAGSITGAPKIRAMQIAASLEPLERGAYCGAVCMFGPDRSMVASVAIRTAVIKDSTLTYGVGCGIVADSDPLRELDESNTKAEVLRRSLRPLTPRVEVASDAAANLQSRA